MNGDETLLLELVNILTNFRPDPAPALAKVVGDDRAQSLTALFELGADTAMKLHASKFGILNKPAKTPCAQTSPVLLI
ncbi:MAG: hypothetical protein CM15mP68_5400 [Pseudomonadota bacterium]|nr:MAG: hypothetical protein CM15mP68_5400 [Pseudomonadota bacterium]